MSTQLRRLTQNPNLRRNQTAELNARMGGLPGILANKNRMADIERQNKFHSAQRAQWDREFALAKENQAFSQKRLKQERQMGKRANQIGMGLEAGKMGLNLATNFGGKTFGGIFNDVKNTFTGGKSPIGPGNFFSNMSVGSTIGGGLAGFGAGSLMGGKSKIKKGLVGLGAGSLMGLLGGGNSFSNMFSSGLAGGIGGLFS